MPARMFYEPYSGKALVSQATGGRMKQREQLPRKAERRFQVNSWGSCRFRSKFFCRKEELGLRVYLQSLFNCSVDVVVRCLFAEVHADLECSALEVQKCRRRSKQMGIFGKIRSFQSSRHHKHPATQQEEPGSRDTPPAIRIHGLLKNKRKANHGSRNGLETSNSADTQICSRHIKE